MNGLLGRLFGRSKEFGRKHLRERERFRADYRILGQHLVDSLDFDSAIDVGCANGFLLEPLAAAGKEVAGVDASPAVHTVLAPELADRVQVGDFSACEGRWDLVCCVEVAEHVPPERSLELVDTLTRLARRWLLFSSAPPGQPGRGHINCRPAEEWLGWLAERGWVPDREKAAALAAELERIEQAPWLRENCMLLRPAPRPAPTLTPTRS